MAKKEIDYSFGFEDCASVGVNDLSFYQEWVQKFSKLFKDHPEYLKASNLSDALYRVATASQERRKNCGMEGVSQTEMAENLKKNGIEVKEGEAISKEQLEKAGPIVKGPIDFKALEYDPFAVPPIVPAFLDEKFQIVPPTDARYDEFLKDCQAAHKTQHEMLIKEIKEHGIDFIKTLSPKVIKMEENYIRGAFEARHGEVVKGYEEKIDAFTKPYTEEKTKEDGTVEKIPHAKGKIDEKQDEYNAAGAEYARLKAMLETTPNLSPEQVAQIKQEMRNQVSKKAQLGKDVLALKAELTSVQAEQAVKEKEQKGEDKSLEKTLKKALKKAEKQEKKETKERISLRQHLADRRMERQNKIEDIRNQNDGKLIIPVLKQTFSELGLFKHKEKVLKASKKEDIQEDRDIFRAEEKTQAQVQNQTGETPVEGTTETQVQNQTGETPVEGTTETQGQNQTGETPVEGATENAGQTDESAAAAAEEEARRLAAAAEDAKAAELVNVSAEQAQE